MTEGTGLEDRVVPEAEIRCDLTRELVVLHARVLRRMPVVQLLVVVGLGIVLRSQIPLLPFLAWGVATLLVETLRAAVAARILDRIGQWNPAKVHRLFIALAGISGGTIGWSCVLFLPHLGIVRQAWLAIVMFAMPAAGVSVSVGSRYILAAYAIGILLPATGTYVRIHPDMFVAAGLSVLFIVFLIAVAADGERLLRRSIEIRKELERSNAQTKAALERAEESAQARARVLASASHDLRQPLHALSVYSAVLAERPDPETLREASRNIAQIVRTLGSLLSGLLDLSQLAAGVYVPERKRFALDRLAREICREFAPAAAAKGITLSCPREAVSVVGDAVAVGRILRNLIDNAVKHTDRGAVSVTTGLDGDHAVAVVIDTGKGIPPAERSRIFEEFYQLDNPGRDRNKGVGLGLAIVQRLCERIGAEIAVQSEPGLGSRFTLRLPNAIQTPDPDPDLGPATEPIRRSFAGLKVAVVDDERDILKGMQWLLDSWQIHVRTVASGRETEEIFGREGPPEVLIVDLRLGEPEHGAALALRMRRTYGDFPVLIMTGETGSEALREAHAAGFPVLQKPVTADALYEAIRAAVGG